MAHRIFVRPSAPGLTVPDPLMGDLFPEGGRDTEKTTYVQRRLAAGELVVAEPPADGTAVAPPAPPSGPAGDDPPADPESEGDTARTLRRRR